MIEKRRISNAGTWGCLGTGMVLLGAFFIYVFEGVGGTDYEYEYAAAAVVAIGAGILIMLALYLRRGHQGPGWPDELRLSVPVVIAILAAIFGVLYF